MSIDGDPHLISVIMNVTDLESEAGVLSPPFFVRIEAKQLEIRSRVVARQVRRVEGTGESFGTRKDG